jgi:DNA-binding transcriptional LysR family regulator
MRWEDHIGRRIKFRDLHIAMTVAQSGTMLKAAQVLAISQPVVSKVVADLEQAVGVRLFDRSKKGVEPTASGRALFHRARAAFDELKQGVKEIEFLNDPTKGELRVGASPALMEGILLAVIDRMSRYHRTLFFISCRMPCRSSMGICANVGLKSGLRESPSLRSKEISTWKCCSKSR